MFPHAKGQSARGTLRFARFDSTTRPYDPYDDDKNWHWNREKIHVNIALAITRVWYECIDEEWRNWHMETEASVSSHSQQRLA